MFYDMVKSNRTFRGFDSERRVSREELLKMVDCARMTASTGNAQALKFYLSWEDKNNRILVSNIKLAGALPERGLPDAGKEPTAYIIICQDLNTFPKADGFLIDVGICAQTILLQANEMGLGGCMIKSFRADAIKEDLQFDENMQPLLVIALGKPAETVVLVDVDESGSTKYYRGENDVHYVPKRKLEDILYDGKHEA